MNVGNDVVSAASGIQKNKFPYGRRAAGGLPWPRRAARHEAVQGVGDGASAIKACQISSHAPMKLFATRLGKCMKQYSNDVGMAAWSAYIVAWPALDATVRAVRRGKCAAGSGRVPLKAYWHCMLWGGNIRDMSPARQRLIYVKRHRRKRRCCLSMSVECHVKYHPQAERRGFNLRPHRGRLGEISCRASLPAYAGDIACPGATGNVYAEM